MDYLIYCSTALVISFGLFYIYAKYKLSYWSRRGVKTPPTNLIFGNFKDCITLKKSAGEVICEIYNSADPDDPYIGFYIFHKPMLLLRNHDLIKQVMITDFQVFPNRRFGSSNERDVVGLDSLLSIKQPRWKYVRGKLTSSLTGQKLKNMLPLMEECGKPMLKFIENFLADEIGQNKFEMKDICSRYINDVIASIAFGINTNSFEEKENAFWKNGLKIFRGFTNSIKFIILFFIPEWGLFIGPLIKEPANYFREIFWDSMNTRERMGYKRGDVIDSLLALKNGNQDPIYKFEGDNLVAQSASLYIAGFEATTTTIAFTLADLSRHPEHQAILYDEIQTHLSGQKMTVDLINEISFLDCVINESMRLHPPLPILDRTAIKDYKLPGTELTIEKGVSVYVSINATCQDPKYFLNPNDFMPSRIEIEQEKKFYETLAFGIGPRACIGQRLAILLVKVALIMILSNYTVCCDMNKKRTNDNAMGFFTYVADGLYLLFKKRDK
ncbi:cytochrome P450 6k1-like [Formica exsecta]|uniref:cytochrome P450 6k1-like n=1 Tax=Formica exsecta TaxID=72781 RepID=UPI001142EE24|nr:cytochrome P450 6k1-like [Formica exsecta]XP_029679684.1 cytochrome P450 6k1-like [Formica exsecta]